jgi:16S rRNA (guanine966-N2)-methyltransferase
LPCKNRLKFLDKCIEKYDLIFADPPYDLPEVKNIPDIIFNNKLLNKNGLFILEHSDKISFTKNTRLKEHRNYGGVNFSIFGT